MATNILSSGRRRVTQRFAISLSRQYSMREWSVVSSSLRSFSSQGTPPARFAVVDHSEAYENAMKGRHGKQLLLAHIDAIGKDDPPFDPFIEDEVMEEYEYEDEGEEGGGGANDEEEGDALGASDDQDELGDEEVSPFNSDGSLRWKKSQLAAFRAGAPAGGVFAVVQLAGSQHKVTTDDVLIVNKVKPVDSYAIGSVHTLKDVMLVSSSHLTLVGMPVVEGAEVDVMVEEITQDAKVIVFKNRRRKNSKRKNGFRRDVTMLRVLDIRMPEPYREHEHREREIVVEA